MVENAHGKSSLCMRILTGQEKFEFEQLKFHLQIQDKKIIIEEAKAQTFRFVPLNSTFVPSYLSILS